MLTINSESFQALRRISLKGDNIKLILSLTKNLTRCG